MIFSTYLFTLAFLPAILLCYTLLLRRGQPRAARWALVLASLCFFAYGAGDFFPVFIVSVFFNYGLARALGTLRAQRREPSARALLVLGVVVNLALLGFYKYTDFILGNVNVFRETPLPLQHILLPVGISFYTGGFNR